MANIQVTFDTDPNNARSESAIVVDPNNPSRLIATSKKFNNLQTYDFTLATEFSTNSGWTWNASAAFTLPTGATLMTDPAVTWDDQGNAYYLGLVGKTPPTFVTIGMVVYKSTDGGQTWGTPNLIHSSIGDDKQWIAGDTNPSSPFAGRVYAVWDDGSSMRFARTLDRGATWTGTAGKTVANTSLAPDSFSPEINVDVNGDVYIVWISNTTVKMLISTDGGDSFTQTTPAATGVTTLSAGLNSIHNWPVLPGGTFRVLTVPSACVSHGRVVVAWDDFREGVSRIYMAISIDKGASWSTGASGGPLITDPLPKDQHHFFPQIIVTRDGIIGCSFYEFGPKPTTPLIDLLLAQSVDGGWTFVSKRITAQAFDPSVNAPWCHHADQTPIDGSVTFLGDYMGLDASPSYFYPLWTDTRTGMQELWTDHVPVMQPPSRKRYDEFAQIIFGIIQDGGGLEIVGGKVVPVPPRGPELEILLAVVAYRAASLISGRAGTQLQKAALQSIVQIAEAGMKSIGY
jgi:hypothetical protein